VPLLVDRGFGLGVVAVEHPSRRGQIKRWVVVLVEQFATHAALTLQNAWLLDELGRKLEENQALQTQLLSKNLDLEVQVAERTKDLTKSLRKVQSVDEQRRRLLAASSTPRRTSASGSPAISTTTPSRRSWPRACGSSSYGISCPIPSSSRSWTSSCRPCAARSRVSAI
jgi:GAF domain-containing protein